MRILGGVRAGSCGLVLVVVVAEPGRAAPRPGGEPQAAATPTPGPKVAVPAPPQQPPRAVDAGALAERGLRVSASAGWVDSGHDLTAGEWIVISAAGEWSNGGESRGPSGFEGYVHPGTISAEAALASLIGRVGGRLFAIGARFEGASPGSGRLELAMNDDPNTLGDNRGSVSVQIERSGGPAVGSTQDLEVGLPCDCVQPNVAGTCFQPGDGHCGRGTEQSGELCYPTCPAGFTGVGPVCWRSCREGFADDGAFCRRDAHIFGKELYGRGAGYALWNESDCQRDNPQGCERSGLLWYPRCRAGFESVGCCICRATGCPAGYSDDGATCRKDAEIYAKETSTRGAGYLKRRDYYGIFYRYIRDHRNIWLPSASPLTEDEKVYLKRFFPAELVDRVRVVELEGMTGAFSHDADATTYGDMIIIKKGERTPGLLKHELVHVCQYDRYGIEGFATRYADQYVDQGYGYGTTMCFEAQAYSFGWMNDLTTPRIATQIGYCGNRTLPPAALTAWRPPSDPGPPRALLVTYAKTGLPASIRVIAARYAGSCISGDKDATAQLAAACDGQVKCDYPLGDTGGASSGCAATLSAQWHCGDPGPARLNEVPVAPGAVIQLSCER